MGYNDKCFCGHEPDRFCSECDNELCDDCDEGTWEDTCSLCPECKQEKDNYYENQNTDYWLGLLKKQKYIVSNYKPGMVINHNGDMSLYVNKVFSLCQNVGDITEVDNLSNNQKKAKALLLSTSDWTSVSNNIEEAYRYLYKTINKK